MSLFSVICHDSELLESTLIPSGRFRLTGTIFFLGGGGGGHKRDTGNQCALRASVFSDSFACLQVKYKNGGHRWHSLTTFLQTLKGILFAVGDKNVT